MRHVGVNLGQTYVKNPTPDKSPPGKVGQAVAEKNAGVDRSPGDYLHKGVKAACGVRHSLFFGPHFRFPTDSSKKTGIMLLFLSPACGGTNRRL
jgi:hypothetical protein